MTTFFLIFLVMLDLVLVVLFLYVNRKQETQGDLLADLTEERRLLAELRETVKEDLVSAHQNSREAVERVSHIAAEAEQEVRSGGATLATSMDKLFDEISMKFEAPLEELAKRQAAIEVLLKKTDNSTARLSKVVNRAEQLTSLLDNKAPYSEVLSELETKKYEDCRGLLSRGLSNQEVATELGLTRAEVDIIASLT